jgi:hypothetical protein
MKTFSIFLYLISVSLVLFSQVPQGIPYQAVIRDTQGNPILNQASTVKFTLHEQTADGTVVYEETHQTSTNSVGLFSLTLGAGVASTGNFSSINWASGYKFLQVQTDIGNGYVDNGTQQLMSVPYALYAGTSGSNQVSNPDIMKVGKGFTMVSQSSPQQLNYSDSFNYCAGLVESGYDDWRIPSLEEVMDYLSVNGFSSTDYYWFVTTSLSRTNDSYFMRVEKQTSSNFFVTASAPMYGVGSPSRNCNCVR